MILVHAQFVLRNMETVGRGPDSAIASGSASATGVSLAVAPPSGMTWQTTYLLEYAKQTAHALRSLQ